jgi:hypothetical protein
MRTYRREPGNDHAGAPGHERDGHAGLSTVRLTSIGRTALLSGWQVRNPASRPHSAHDEPGFMAHPLMVEAGHAGPRQRATTPPWGAEFPFGWPSLLRRGRSVLALHNGCPDTLRVLGGEPALTVGQWR